MNGLILQGPFLTRAEAGRRAGLPGRHISHRPDLLRAGGRTYKEAYFALQFDETGIRDDIGRIVLALRGRITDVAIADWLVRGSPALEGMSPLSWLNRGGDLRHLLAMISELPAVEMSPPNTPNLPAAGAAAPGRHPRVTPRHPRPRARLRPAGSH